MTQTSLIKPYHTTHTEFHKNGIYIRFLGQTDNTDTPDQSFLFHKFIQIKTLGTYPQIPYKNCTNEETLDYQDKIRKYRDKFTAGRYTHQEFMEKINAIRNRAVLIERPLTFFDHRKEWIDTWKDNRIQKDIEQNLIALLNNQIKLQLFSLNPHRQKYLLLLIDQGPNYPPSVDKIRVINRPSPLEFYSSIRKLHKYFTIDADLIISPQQYYFNSHPQQMYLSSDTLHALLAQYLPQQQFNTNLDPIIALAQPKHRAITSGSNVDNIPEPNYIFTMESKPPIDPEYYSPNQYEVTDYYLNPGTKLLVQGDKPTLHKFIMNYSYRNLLFPLQRYFQNVDCIRDRIDHPSDLLTRKIILFSPLRSIGFTPISITDLRLDMLRLTTKGEELQFMIIFNTIDIVYGEHYFSALTDLMKVIQQVAEYDENELSRIKTVDQLLSLLASQLTNQSFISKSESVVKLYHLFRKFTLRSVLDPIDENPLNEDSSDVTQDQVYTNIERIMMPFSSIDTSKLVPEDGVILCFLLIYQLGILRNKSELQKLDDLTIIIEDKAMHSIFARKEVISHLDKIMGIFPGLRIVFLSTNDYSPLTNLPTLDLSPKLNLNQSHVLKLGSAQKYQVYTDNLSQWAIKLLKKFETELENELVDRGKTLVPMDPTNDPVEGVN